jgi:hypothetical protein
MSYKIGVVANLLSGGGYGQFEEVFAEIERQQGRVFYYFTDSVTKVSGALITLVERDKVDALFVYGGDGTLHKVVDALIYEHGRGRISRIPPILPLGGGTQKSLFQWLGWGGSFLHQEKPIQIFRKALRSPLEHLPIRKRQPLQIKFVNRLKDREETHYGFIFIMGSMNRVIQLYDSSGASVSSGLKHIGLATMGSITGHPRSHAELMSQFRAQQWADGKELERDDPLAIVCSVTESLLFGVEPFLGHPESNQFYAASYAVPPIVGASMVPLFWRGKVPRLPRFFNQPVFSFGLTPETEDSFFIDGDFYQNEPGKPLNVDLGPEVSLISRF